MARALTALLLAAFALAAAAVSWPGEDWPRSSPERQGADSLALARMIDAVAQPGRRIDALLVVRRGHVIAEWVVAPYGADELHDLRSVTKSVVSTLVAVALQRGDLRALDQGVAEFVPLSPASDPRRRAMTIDHLLNMRSGTAWQEWPYDQESDLMRMAASADWLAYIMNRPMRDPPGARFWYSGADAHLLSAVLQRATSRSLSAYARENLFGPIGIEHWTWLRDPQGLSIGDSALALRPHDLARLGWLLLTDGVWKGKRLLPAGWLEQVLADPPPHGLRQATRLPPGFKRMWWVDPGVPMLLASGRHGQHLLLLPRQQALLVLVSKAAADGEPNIDLRQILQDHLLPALRSSVPLAPNPPGERALRQAISSRSTAPPLVARPPSPSALAVSGHRFRLEPNRQGMSALELQVDERGQGRVWMAWGNRPGDVLDRPFGPEGRFAMSSPTPWGVFATRAAWRDERTLIIESERLQGATVTRYRISVTPDGITLTIEDPESPKEVVRGRR